MKRRQGSVGQKLGKNEILEKFKAKEMASGSSSSAQRRVATAQITHAQSIRRRAANAGATEGQKSPTSLVIAPAVQSRDCTISTFGAKDAPDTPFGDARARQNARAGIAKVPRPR